MGRAEQGVVRIGAFHQLLESLLALGTIYSDRPIEVTRIVPRGREAGNKDSGEAKIVLTGLPDIKGMVKAN
jgi:hypothetical protein